MFYKENYIQIFIKFTVIPFPSNVISRICSGHNRPVKLHIYTPNINISWYSVIEIPTVGQYCFLQYWTILFVNINFNGLLAVLAITHAEQQICLHILYIYYLTTHTYMHTYILLYTHTHIHTYVIFRICTYMTDTWSLYFTQVLHLSVKIWILTENMKRAKVPASCWL